MKPSSSTVPNPLTQQGGTKAGKTMTFRNYRYPPSLPVITVQDHFQMKPREMRAWHSLKKFMKYHR